ncbi:MAG: hypothetical protein N4A40_01865 [Tissierellales bacterium]|nr:hypothetical protein [Tissierellales bacterium]
MYNNDSNSKFNSMSLPKLSAIIIIFSIAIIGLTFYINSQKLNDPLLGDRALRAAIMDEFYPEDKEYLTLNDSLLEVFTSLELDLSKFDITSFEGLNKMSSLDYLDIKTNRDLDLSNVDLPNLSKLRLSINSNEVANITLPDSNILERLIVSSDRLFIDPSFIDSLNNYDQLKILEIKNPYFKRRDDESIYENCSFLAKYPSIKDLDLKYSDIKSLDGIENLNKLAYIRFHDCSIEDASALLKLDNIISLDMTDVSISEEQIKQLEEHFGQRLDIDDI